MAYLPGGTNGPNGGRINFNYFNSTGGNGALISTGTVYLSGGNNITLSQNGGTISVNATGPNLSRWEYPQQMFGPTNTSQANFQGSLSIQHMYIPLNVSASEGKIGGQLSAFTTSNGSLRTASISLWMGIYTLSGSTLSLMTSGSANNTIQHYGGSSTASSSVNNGVNGMRQFTVPFYTTTGQPSVNITAGEYWVGAVMSSSVQTTNQSLSFTQYGNNQIAGGAGSAVLTPVGSSGTAARDVILFQGIRTGTAFAMPASIANTDVNNTGASFVQWANFYNALYNATY